MIEHIPDSHLSAENLPVKQRCPADGHAMLFFTSQGVSVRCRFCKGVYVVSWQEVLRRHAELHGLQIAGQ